MILYQNGIIKLDYDPATDILLLEWPDFHTYLMPDIGHSISILLETIRNYDVKNILIDSSKTIMDVDDAEYKTVMHQFVQDVMKTRLRKMARIETNDFTREQNMNMLEEETRPTFLFKNFKDRSSAFQWLTAEV